MGRRATGCAVWESEKWWARITLADGTRTLVDMEDPTMSDAKAGEMATVLSEEERRTDKLLGAKLAAGGKSPVKGGAPVGERFVDWFGRRCEARRAKGLATVTDDDSRFRTWIAPFKCADGVTLGDKGTAQITKRDLESFVENIDRKVQSGDLMWKTAINVWAVLTGSFRDACRSKVLALRVREDNPAADVEGPDRGSERSKVFVYPNEFKKFVSCRRIPLTWRRLVAVGVYLGARAGELEALEWDDIDLAHGKVTVHRTIDREAEDDDATKVVKDKDPRDVDVEVSLSPLLKAMHRESAGRGRVFPDFPRHRDLAERLREYMKLAGVDRAALFITDATRIRLRFHDLRASTVTWMAVRGDGVEKIWQRVGHEDWETMRDYMRVAKVLVTGFGTVFPPLPKTLFFVAPLKLVPKIKSDESSEVGQVYETIAGRTGLEFRRACGQVRNAEHSAHSALPHSSSTAP